jgi:flagellar basal-body rod modification protein FlgD
MSAIDTGLSSAIGQINGTPTEPAAKKDAFGQDAFLRLMITQLKNQNPLEPMKNQEFLAQLSSFTTASGVQDLKKSFDSLGDAMQSNQALQASSLVGRSVVVPSDRGYLSSNAPVAGVIDVPEAIGNMRVTIFNAAGEIVKTLELGAQDAGQAKFAWDGVDNAGRRQPPGTYRFTAESTFNGTTYQYDTYALAPVESVTIGRNGQGLVLNLGGLGPVNLSSVAQIL